MAGFDDLRDILKEFYFSGQLIPEIYLEDHSEDSLYPELTGVRVISVGREIVILQQASSPGVELFAIRIDEIAGIELPSSLLNLFRD